MIIDSYQSIFYKIYNRRLKYLLNINLIASLFLPYFHQIRLNSIGYDILINFILKTPIFFISLFLIKQVRKKYSTVEYSTCKTLSSQVYHTFSNLSFFVKNWVFYFLSGFLIFSISISQFDFGFQYYLLSKEYRSKPLINDQFIYYWFTCVFVSLFYNFNQLVFQRNRLNFKYGHNRQDVQFTLFQSTNLVKVFSQSIGITLILCIASPIIYVTIKDYIYKFNYPLIYLLHLDPTTPKFNLSFVNTFKLIYLSYMVILIWEFENYIFNVYSMIGCLDGKKSISSYASDPTLCLINGLSHENKLVRLTAFQELAYISSSDEPQASKLRGLIFSQRSKKYDYWNKIYNLCLDEINITNQRINYRTESDLKALENLSYNDSNLSKKNKIDLFGNSITDLNRDRPAIIQDYTSTKSSTPFEKYLKYFNFHSRFVTQFNNFFNYKNSNFKQSLTGVVHDFYSSKFGFIFRITPRRDSQSRVLNSVVFGNSIIAISNLILKSIELDKLEITSDRDLCDILNLLGKVIRTTNNYCEYPPRSIFINDENEMKQVNLVGLLHDLSMHHFYQICIIFNFKLNDLILSPRTYKLAKWVTDLAIEKKKEMRSMNV